MTASNYAPSEIGFRIYPTHVVQYFVRDGAARGRSRAQLRAQLNLQFNKPKGEVSKKAAKRIKNAVNWLVVASKRKRVYSKIDSRTYQFQLNFITLTLPSLDHGLTDHQFKNKLLRNWLERMKYRHGLRNYVWKVETQENGNIHAHITSDCFIHYREIRDAWNSILIKNGLMRTFADKHGHSDPNSTDVKSVRSIKNLSAYLAKYFSKSEEDRRKVAGRLWSCSHSLSDRNFCNIIVPPTDDHYVLASLIDSDAEQFIVEGEPDKTGLRRKLATVFFMRPQVWRSLRGTIIHSHFINHVDSIRTGTPYNSEESVSLKSYQHVKFNSKFRDPGDVRNPQSTEVEDSPPPGGTCRDQTRRSTHRQLDLFQ